MIIFIIFAIGDDSNWDFTSNKETNNKEKLTKEK